MKTIRDSLKDLKPYKPQSEQTTIKLDANESKNYLIDDTLTFNDLSLNLYPDSNANVLRSKLSAYINVAESQILVGNGSSEMIELILKTFIESDNVVLGFDPSFSMYAIYTKIYNGRYIGVPSKTDFKLDIDDMIDYAKTYQPKLIFLCSPNNPTGQIIPQTDIVKLIKSTDALICLDEAYIEFSENADSMMSMVDEFDNLMVIRTFSKAFGLAGIRLGYLVSNQNIVNELYKVKSPYNLNAVTQNLGIYALSQIEKVNNYTKNIIEQRFFVEKALAKLNLKVYSSEANFIFFQSLEPNLYNKLIDKDIRIRAFSDNLKNYYRVTIGSPDENKQFIKAMKEIIT